MKKLKKSAGNSLKIAFVGFIGLVSCSKPCYICREYNTCDNNRISDTQNVCGSQAAQNIQETSVKSKDCYLTVCLED